MRKFAFPAPPFAFAQDPKLAWMVNAIREVSNASHDQITEEIADAYTVTNLTESRTLDCDTATVAELADVVGTLILDMQKRGVKRG